MFEECRIIKEQFEHNRRDFETRKGRKGRREDRYSVTKKKGAATTKYICGW